MTADSSLNALLDLRERLAALRVVRCRMVHERVRLEDGMPQREDRGDAEPSMVRMGLCKSEVRGRNLACGHTMARYVLLDAVHALHAAGTLSESEHAHLFLAVEHVANDIHRLDHRKGAAEKYLALTLERKTLTPGGDGDDEATHAAAEVRQIEWQHDVYAEQIRALQNVVLAHLETAIRRAAPEPHPLDQA